LKTKTLFVILAVVMFVAGLISGHVVSSHYSSNTVYTVVTSDSIDIIMKDLHGLKHCIYGRGENGDPGVFFFYHGVRCLVLLLIDGIINVKSGYRNEKA